MDGLESVCVCVFCFVEKRVCSCGPWSMLDDMWAAASIMRRTCLGFANHSGTDDLDLDVLITH